MSSCNFLQVKRKLKGFRATLNGRKFKKWRSWSSFFSYNHLELNLGLSLRGYIIAMVIYKFEKTTITSSPKMRHLVDIDTVIVASTDKEC